jgi:stage II sporulation protein D
MRFRPLALLTLIVALLAAAPAAQGATRFVIRGAGFGHGVGLSQYGAQGYAQQGRKHDFILRHYFTGTRLQRLSRIPTVRVLLRSGSSSSAFSGAAQVGNRRVSPGRTYRARSGGGRVTLTSASGRKIASFAAPMRAWPPRGGVLRVAGRGIYRGILEFRPGTFGGVNTINAVNVEDYVRGVVPVEVPASWHPEALKAQAVAARTYGITTSRRGAGWDHYPDTRSQVYGGAGVEQRTTNAAIAATRAQVVTYNGRPVTTYFFSTSGGRTENSEYGFPGGNRLPWLRSVSDPYDRISPRHRWGPYRMTMGRAASKLGGLVKGTFRRIDVAQRGVSPRIVRATVVGSRGSTAVTGATLRARFGLYDSWMYFAVVRTDARSAGRRSSGAGNGVVAALRRLAKPAGTLSGRVTPSRRGQEIAVQRRAGGRWRTAQRVRIGRAGSYSTPVWRRGTYRVVVFGMPGPSVRVR